MISISVGIEFQNEVLGKGRESTLPSNLSDKWLHLLLAQANDLVNGRSGMNTTEIVAALLHVISAKFSPGAVSLDESELFNYFEQYQQELASEEIRRRTDLALSPTTIDKIFSAGARKQ